MITKGQYLMSGNGCYKASFGDSYSFQVLYTANRKLLWETGAVPGLKISCVALSIKLNALLRRA
jgi:hypothetical protein